MNPNHTDLFSPASLGDVRLRNRFIRSATFEGAADSDGNPTDHYEQILTELAAHKLGAIITGFVFSDQTGRAIQPGQAGINLESTIQKFRQITDAVHKHECAIFLQISHAGRQTNKRATKGKVHGVSSRKSHYFGSIPEVLNENEISQIEDIYAQAARNAQMAGFDGIQLHCAHGYLIHQFLHPAINDRQDMYGLDPVTGIGTLFLSRIIEKTRELCGISFPILVKISGGDDLSPVFTEKNLVDLTLFLDSMNVAGIEVSYGTMENALNIFRGSTIPIETILKYNARYGKKNRLSRFLWKRLIGPVLSRQIKPFTPLYNLANARIVKQNTSIPVIYIGGLRNGKEMAEILESKSADFLSLSRPLICEPDLVCKIEKDPMVASHCLNCNICAIMCDSGKSTRCYHGRTPD